jgi:hypothetical protein
MFTGSRARKTKGQFFIIGALFICILLFFGMSPQVNIIRAGTADMEWVGKNLQKEFPHALNIGINKSEPVSVLYNFTLFSIDAVEQGRTDLDCHWLVFRREAGQVNVSGGNFMDSPLNFDLNVSGVSKTLYVENGTVNSTMFPVSGYTFDVTVLIEGESASFTLLANKTSIYGGLELERGGNLVRKEILA